MSTNSTSSPRILMALTVAGLLAVGCSTIKSGNGPTGEASTTSPTSAAGASSTSPVVETTALVPTTLLASGAAAAQPLVTTAPEPKPAQPQPAATVPRVLAPVAAATTRTAAQVPQAPTIAPGTGQTTTLTGLVMQIDSTGDFDLTYGNVRLRIVMQPTTVVLNLRGKEVIRPYIQPSNNVQVTGTLVGTTLTAQTVVVQTTKDGV